MHASTFPTLIKDGSSPASPGTGSSIRAEAPEQRKRRERLMQNAAKVVEREREACFRGPTMAAACMQA